MSWGVPRTRGGQAHTRDVILRVPPHPGPPVPGSHLSVDVHLPRGQQQLHHLQVPVLGRVVQAGGAVLLLGGVMSP